MNQIKKFVTLPKQTKEFKSEKKEEKTESKSGDDDVMFFDDDDESFLEIRRNSHKR